MIKLITVLVLIFSVSIASGNWELCGPGGSRVYNLCSTPGAVFASVYRPGFDRYECFKSTDGGENWEFVSLIDTMIDYLIADSHARLIGWKANNILISENQAESWSTITLEPEHYIVDVASDPEDVLRFLAIKDGNSSSPLLESSDGGISWNFVENLPMIKGCQVEFSTFDTSRIYFAGTTESRSSQIIVYTSTNAGLTWTDVSPSITSVSSWISDMCISPFNDQVVFLSSGNKIYKSSDAGGNWIMALSASQYINNIEFHPTNPDSIFACTDGDVYHSGNGGLDWWISPNPCDFNSINTMAVSNDGLTRIHIGDNNGLALSVNGGYAWSIANNGIPGGSVYAMHENPESGFPVLTGNGFFLNEEQYSGIEIELFPYLLTSHLAVSYSDPDLWFAAGDAG